MAVVQAIFRIRRDTAANWTAANPVLALGEPGLETDTRKVKYGDGATAWNALNYSGADGTVTSVNASGGTTGLSFAGGPIVGAGTLTLGGTLEVANGGTGETTSTGTGSIVKATGPAFSGFRFAAAGGWSSGLAGQAYAASDIGLVFGGQGTDFDLYFLNKNGAGIMCIPTGANAFTPGGDNSITLGQPALRWSTVYAGTGTINTSDKRDKRDIGGVPDEWLDAWGDVEWCRFRFRDGNRWHVGLVAQQVRDAFAARGLDACEIGLLCFDEWERRPGRRAKGGLPAIPGRRAGNRWGLRYDECQALEAAWQRRELARLRKMVEG